MRAEPRVSILVNSYNYGRYLGDAVESALAQRYPRCEVVVVDDGSTDGSREIIASYGERIVPVLKSNGGQASAFNAGFAGAGGDILCLLDADDVFFSEKVTRVVEALAAHPEAGWCFHELEHVGELPAAPGHGVPVVAEVVDVRARVEAGGGIPFVPPATTGLSFTRGLLGRLLPMPEEIRITSDNYLKWAAIGLAPGVRIETPLGYQRIHGDNAYTAREGPRRAALGAQVAAQTSRVMRERHPELRRFARGVLIDALAAARAVEGDAPALDGALRAALGGLSALDRAAVRARGWLRYQRHYRRAEG